MANEVEKKVAEIKAPKRPNNTDVVKVFNTSKTVVCTSKGVIKPGEKGEATYIEAVSYNKKLEII